MPIKNRSTIVDNVAALALLSLGDGDTVQTIGYSQPNIGAGLYLYHKTGRSTHAEDLVLYFDGPGADDYLELLHDGTVDITQAGAVQGGSAAANSTAIQRAIDAMEALVVAQSFGGTIRVPRGTFDFDTGLTINQNGIHIVGDGQFTSRLRYTGGAGSPILFTKGAALLYSCSIVGLTIVCTDTANTKNCIHWQGACECHMEDIVITDCRGGDSVGVYIEGHEIVTMTRCQITATVPIRISQCTVTPGVVDCDHFHFQDLYLRHGASGAPSTLIRAMILLDNDVYVSNLTIDGQQAWVGGEHGFYFNRTDVTAAACHNIKIENFRHEQQAVNTGYTIYHAANASRQTLSVHLSNGRTSSGGKGIYLRRCYDVTIDHFVHPGSSDTLNLDLCGIVHTRGIWTAGGGSAIVLGSMELMDGIRPQGFGTYTYYSHATYGLWGGRQVDIGNTTFITLADAGETPSVDGYHVVVLTNAAPESVTNFTGGINGQPLEVHLDANTTITDSATIDLDTSTGGSFSGGSGGGIISFRRMGGVWKQVGEATNF